MCMKHYCAAVLWVWRTMLCHLAVIIVWRFYRSDKNLSLLQFWSRCLCWNLILCLDIENMLRLKLVIYVYKIWFSALRSFLCNVLAQLLNKHLDLEQFYTKSFIIIQLKKYKQWMSSGEKLLLFNSHSSSQLHCIMSCCSRSESGFSLCCPLVLRMVSPDRDWE